MLRPARASKFTVQIRLAAGLPPRKLAKLVFAKSDGSVFLDFPYFAHSEGLAACVHYPAGAGPSANFRMTDSGKVTSHLVKYAHHRDGEAHFSQTGKVRTEIRKPSVPLSLSWGHLFTLQIEGFDAFEPGKGSDPDFANERDQPITFLARGKAPSAIKIVGFWYSRPHIRRGALGGHGGPRVIPTNRPAGEEGILVAPPVGSGGSSSFLLLLASAIAPFGTPPGPHLAFIGGFDSREVVEDLGRPTSFLALSYPASDFTALVSTIGTIDLRPVPPNNVTPSS